jgi:hypothetical protein
MFKQSWASLGQNIHYLGVICLIFFPLVALTFLANIFGVYWGMNDALSACRNALAGQDLTAIKPLCRFGLCESQSPEQFRNGLS